MFPRSTILSTAIVMILTLSACGTTSQPVANSDALPADATQATATSASTTEEISPDNYILGQGDRISIQVFDEPDLTMEAGVGASGIINYSYLGDVRVSGKTPFQLEQHITELLRNGYLVNPAVNVSVTQFRPFFIGGEVRSPGSYPYQPGLTLDQAIALAGGLTDRASQRQMFISKAGNASSNQKRSALGDSVGPGDTVTIKEGFF